MSAVLLYGTTGYSIPSDWIVMDTEDLTSGIIGTWVSSTYGAGYNGTDYRHDGNALKGTKSVLLTPDLPTNSNYNVYLNWASNPNRASNTPITINHADGSTILHVDQREFGVWVLLGTFPFSAGTEGSLLIETTGTDGYVVADAAAWQDVNAEIEIPEINISATVSATTEGDMAQPAIITLTRSGSSNAALEVSLDIAGTATPVDDYTAIAETNLFPAGESARTFMIWPPDDGVAEGTESISVTALAGTGYTLGSQTVAQVIVEDSPFDLWRAEKFTAVELVSSNISSAFADPDGDGTNNLGEFFAASNPKISDAGPGLQMSHDGTNALVHLPRNPAASELDVVPKTSSDLKNWWPVSKDISAVADGASPLETLTYAIPANNETKQFWGASIRQPAANVTSNSVAFWSFDTAFDGSGASVDTVTYFDGRSASAVVSQSGTASAILPGGAASYFGPDGNSWFGSGDSTSPGHSLIWSPGSQTNQFTIDISTLLQEEIRIRFDIRSAGSSALNSFSGFTYDTGTGPLPVPDADLSVVADGQFNVWSVDLGVLDAINGRSSVTLTWAFDPIADSPDAMVQIDNVVVSTTGRAKCQLVRNLEAGRLQTVVTLGTSITSSGAWVGHLSESLKTNYHGLATVLNSGASGMNSEWGVANINSLVLQKNPDTLFIEYSINDSVERFDITVDEARANLEYIINTTLANHPQCEIILMTMTPGDKYSQGHASYRKDIKDHYAMYRAVASERGFVVIDHYSSWIALQMNDVDQFNAYVPDSIHPVAEGNAAVVSPVIIDTLGIGN
jgi:acyl-CoA thioesterase-1